MTGLLAWVTGEAPPTELTVSEINSSYMIIIIIAVSVSACLAIATPIVYTSLVSKKKAQRAGNYHHSLLSCFFFFSIYLGPTNAENVPEVLLERSDIPLNYIYTVAATSIVFFIINLFVMLWYIVRKRNKTRKSKNYLNIDHRRQFSQHFSKN